MSKINQFIWQEKYRAKKLSDLLIPKKIKSTLEKFLKEGDIPHFLFYGSPGTQKTTTSKVLINELKADDLYINASNETGIDTVRSKIVDFISTRSINKNKKIVVLDECESFSQNASKSLKVILEEYSKFSKFILITNHYNQINDALKSRCTEINFNFETKEENNELKKLYLKRSFDILRQENVSFDENSKKTIMKLVVECFPDMRRIVKELQRLSKENDNNFTDLNFESTQDKIQQTFEKLFNEDIIKTREFILNNFNVYELDSIYRLVYKIIDEKIKNKILVAQAIIIIGKYLYQHSMVADKEINIMAMFSELLVEVIQKDK